MVKVYYENDADLSALQGRSVAVMGYGSQGNAQANCMRDSGVKVILGLRPRFGYMGSYAVTPRGELLIMSFYQVTV